MKYTFNRSVSLFTDSMTWASSSPVASGTAQSFSRATRAHPPGFFCRRAC